ncbi:rhomboid [Micractinium conductrix]|uniref:Rhomboid n=1 Tax=Micractinium conductrix TaxID=554055 RepID=A0A2P6V343_9CHLO|nr:rhomboid [Micractinium conductrix]|eukprot:PSC68502.1 rhomboid [Micractinium conductrix]
MPLITSETSLSTRGRVFWNSLPFITRCVLGVCTATYAVTALLGSGAVGALCMAPAPLLRGELYRVLTSALTHASLLHLVLNMAAFVQMGASLERALGSLHFLWAQLLILGLGEGLYLAAAAVAHPAPAALPPWLDWWRQCAVGYSGVLFGLIMIETRLSGAASRSVAGLFSVPAAAYPWVLFVLLQVLVPHVSLLGHLTGLLVGQAYAQGWLRWAQPSGAACAAIERSAACASCMAPGSSFVAHTGGSGAGESLLPTRAPSAGGGDHHSGWFQGPWMPFPPSSNRLRLNLSGFFGGEQAAAAGAPPAQQQQGSAAQGGAAQQQQQGVRLGGQQQAADAKAAAAAAAEARASAGSRSSGSSRGQP